MLISSSTDIISGIGQVSSGVFSDFLPYILIIIGIILGFTIIEILLHILSPDKYPPVTIDYEFSEYDKFRISQIRGEKGDPMTRSGSNRYKEL